MKIFLAILQTDETGCPYAFAETIKSGENLACFIKRWNNPPTIRICDTATQAHQLAAAWNDTCKNNGTPKELI